MGMSRPRPNIPLQRTPSALPPSPLSFGTLGGGGRHCLRFLAGFFLFLPGLGPSLQACSCPPDPPPREAVKRSAVAFQGTVVAIGVDWEGRKQHIGFRVTRVFKGPLSESFRVTTNFDEATCGYTFSRDREYVVFAVSSPTGLSTFLCDGNLPIERATSIKVELGAGRRPRRAR
jgi:hypothetical protein